jgi:5-methyltetrahydropteroyltriglutamate--homocysteine methyltransferase
VLDRLKAQGVQWVQMDEPILGLDLPAPWRSAFESTYWQLNQVGVPLLLATYFSPLEENLSLACRLPVAGLHVDGVRAPQELTSIADWLPVHKVLSVGIVDGRNIWRTDLDAALAVLAPIAGEKRAGKLWLSSSCSLLHVPFTWLARPRWMARSAPGWRFATEKLDELYAAQSARCKANTPRHEARRSAGSPRNDGRRRASARVHQPAVRSRIDALPDDADQRKRSGFAQRQASSAPLQAAGLPDHHHRLVPANGGDRVRPAPASSAASLNAPITRRCAPRSPTRARQEALGLDVLVHGEAERNDMVEYFGEQLDGFAFTQFGWVQSYGSRCVKPPIIFGDVSRPKAMTVDWTATRKA